MTVRDRVFSAFKESFDLDDDVDTSKLVYQEYPAWTSIGHMILVAALEFGSLTPCWRRTTFWK